MTNPPKNLRQCRLEVLKNRNVEKWKFGKMKIGENEIWKNENLEKWKIGKMKFAKMKIGKNVEW